jgi:hypothetical protein
MANLHIANARNTIDVGSMSGSWVLYKLSNIRTNL